MEENVSFEVLIGLCSIGLGLVHIIHGIWMIS